MAGVLSLLGCDTPATPMKATEANEKGYFESNSIYGLHSDLLKSAGSSWDDWLPINPGWFKSARVEEFHDRALDLLKKEFGGSRLFVLKDPRICRLLPFWEDVLKESGVAPRYVMIHRNPLEVAASLAKRDGLHTATGNLIWLRHVLDAETGTRDKTRCFVNFESLLSNWAGTMTKIQDILGVPLPRLSVSVAPEVEAFLDLDLRHHVEKPKLALDNPLLSEWVRDTYAILEKWAADGESKADHKTLDSIRASLTSAGTTFAPVIQESRKTTARLEDREKAVSDLQKDRDKLESDLAESAKDRELLNKRLSDTITARDRVAEDRDEVCEERDTLLRKRDSLIAESASLRISRDQVASDRENIRIQNAELTEKYDGVLKARDKMSKELDNLKLKSASLEEDQVRAANERERLNAEKLTLASARDQLQIAYDRAAQDHDRLASEVNTIAQERDRLTKAQTELTQEREGLRKSLQETRASMDEFKNERHAQKQALKALKNELSQAESALAQRSHEAEQTHRELQSIKAEQSDRDLRFVEMKTGLARKETALAQEAARISSLKRTVSEKSNEVAVLSSSLTTQNREIADLTRILRETEHALQAEVADLKSRGAYAEAAYESMKASTSWRITSPLRWLASKVRN